MEGCDNNGKGRNRGIGPDRHSEEDTRRAERRLRPERKCSIGGGEYYFSRMQVRPFFACDGATGRC